MDLIDDIKISLRISSSAYNTEITDCINACKTDLTIAGVKNIDETDALIKRAINLYVKASFGYNNPDADRLMKSYEMLKTHLSLSSDYSFYTITLTITDSETTDPIQEASVKLWNDELNYQETKSTNANGIVIFNVRDRSNYKYDITATYYESDLHQNDDKNIHDVSTNTTVEVALLGV